MISLLIMVFFSTAILAMIFQISISAPFFEAGVVSVCAAILITSFSYLPIKNMIIIEEEVLVIKDAGYRYFKTIDGDHEKNKITKDIDHLRYICDGNKYKVLNKKYAEVSTNSHLFREETSYLFCKDESPHENMVSNIDLEKYKFIAKFSEYPVSYLISKFCDLKDAVVVDKKMKLITAKDITLNSRGEAYLYCSH